MWKCNADNTEKIVLTIIPYKIELLGYMVCFLALKMNGLHIICVQELGIPYFYISYNYIYMSAQKDIIDSMKPYLTAYGML